MRFVSGTGSDTRLPPSSLAFASTAAAPTVAPAPAARVRSVRATGRSTSGESISSTSDCSICGQCGRRLHSGTRFASWSAMRSGLRSTLAVADAVTGLSHIAMPAATVKAASVPRISRRRLKITNSS